MEGAIRAGLGAEEGGVTMALGELALTPLLEDAFRPITPTPPEVRVGHRGLPGTDFLEREQRH